MKMVFRKQTDVFSKLAIALVLFVFFGLSVSCGESAGQDSTNASRWAKVVKMYDNYKKESFPDAPEITVEQLMQLEKEQKKIVLVDVRSQEEMKVSMIPGAISKEEFEKNRSKYKNYLIIPYCTIGYRSGLYTRKLVENGISARNLMGGILAWAYAGRKFASPSGDSTKVHVYGKKWDLLPDNYQAVY